MLPVLLCLAILAGGDPPLDTIHLVKGKPLTGVILRMDAEELVLAQGTRTRTIKLADVQAVEGPRVAYRDYVDKLRQLCADPAASAAAANELAAWAEEHGLLRDTDALRLRALALDPADATAHEALGHTRRGEDWVVQVGNGGRTTWDKLLERCRDMQEPWEFSTFHFDVTAAGDLKQILDAAAELEETYAAFFELFQHGVGFHEVQAPIPVFLSPDRENFPSQSNFLDAYFHVETRSLRSYFSEGRASRLVHEGVHAVMYYAARELERKDPQLPGWLEEGLASYLDASLRGTPGALALDPGRIDEGSFREHHETDRKDDLVRVLNYQSGDFGASTGQTRRYAQSYTLVHFLLHGNDGNYAAPFAAFLASSFRTQSSMSHFKKIFELRDLDGLQAEWEAYVAEHAPKG